MDRELETILVLVDEAFDLKEVVLLEGVEDFFDVVPHLGFDLAAAITERKRQVRLAGFLGLDLLADDDETRGNDLVLVARAIADVEVFHGWSEYKGRGESRDQSTPSTFFLFLASFLASDSLAAAVSMGLVWFGLAPESM